MKLKVLVAALSAFTLCSCTIEVQSRGGYASGPMVRPTVNPYAYQGGGYYGSRPAPTVRPQTPFRPNGRAYPEETSGFVGVPWTQAEKDEMRFSTSKWGGL